MKDKWMNVGFEDDELRPYVEPDSNMNDQVRIGKWELKVGCVQKIMWRYV